MTAAYYSIAQLANTREEHMNVGVVLLVPRSKLLHQFITPNDTEEWARIMTAFDLNEDHLAARHGWLESMAATLQIREGDLLEPGNLSWFIATRANDVTLTKLRNMTMHDTPRKERDTLFTSYVLL